MEPDIEESFWLKETSALKIILQKKKRIILAFESINLRIF